MFRIVRMLQKLSSKGFPQYTRTLFLIAIFILCLSQPCLAQAPMVFHEGSIYIDEEEHSLYSPITVLADQVTDEIYVVSGSKIIIYSSDFFPVFTMDRGRGIESAQGLAVDKDGTLYIAQCATKTNPKYRISVFNACLRWQKDIYIPDLEGKPFTTTRLALDSKGNIYAAGEYYQGVMVLDKEGEVIDFIAPEEKNKRAEINDVFVDANDRIYLLSEESGHVYVYDVNRQFLFQFGRKGSAAQGLSRAVAVDRDPRTGRYYVADYMRHTILAYDQDGKYLFEFGGRGISAGWLQYPMDLTVDRSGRIIIADTFNNRVEVYKPYETKGGP